MHRAASSVDRTCGVDHGSWSLNGSRVTLTTMDTPLNGRVLSPVGLRQALDGRWLYLVGDSSTRGLFISLLQQVSNMQGGSTMDSKHWLGSDAELKLMQWADVILNASDGSLIGSISRPMSRWGKRYPYTDGGVFLSHCLRPHAASLAHLWCTGWATAQATTSCTSISSPSRCWLTLATGNLSKAPLAAAAPCPLSSDEMRVRGCQPTGMIRLTYRFAAYAHQLAHDHFLELSTRWLIPGCDAGALEVTPQG